MLMIGTMTLNEVTQRLRELGVRTSEMRVAEAIEKGLYPRGICIHGHQNRCFEIYTRLFDAWVAERATEVDFSEEARAG